MIVVADTSPLTALISVGSVEILPKLFNRIIIPPAVWDELLAGHSTLPSWIEVTPVQHPELAVRFAAQVDRGEAEAIELAKELKADRLLIDDMKGRRLAESEGLPIIGLLGVILIAKRSGIIPSARILLDELDCKAGIYLASNLVESALKSIGEQ